MVAWSATGNMAAVLVTWCAALTLLSSENSVGARAKVRRHSLRTGKTTTDDGVCELEISCKSDDLNPLLPVRLPIRGPRGPPGPKGERGAPGEDGLTNHYRDTETDRVAHGNGNALQSSAGLVSGLRSQRKMAFFVGLSENLGPVHENTDVLFDRIVTNLGSGYSRSTGRFTSPTNATYQFNVIISAQGRQKAAVMMVKNGAMVATVWAESIPFWASASNVAILSLAPGDQVWLQLLSRASYLHGYMYSTFSGFLIFEN